MVTLLSSRIKAFLNLSLALSVADANKSLLLLKTLLLAAESTLGKAEFNRLWEFSLQLYTSWLWSHGVSFL